jgi:hypothetical protein
MLLWQHRACWPVDMPMAGGYAHTMSSCIHCQRLPRPALTAQPPACVQADPEVVSALLLKKGQFLGAIWKDLPSDPPSLTREVLGCFTALMLGGSRRRDGGGSGSSSVSPPPPIRAAVKRRYHLRVISIQIEILT